MGCGKTGRRGGRPLRTHYWWCVGEGRTALFARCGGFPVFGLDRLAQGSIIEAEQALRQAVGPGKIRFHKAETVTCQSGGFCVFGLDTLVRRGIIEIEKALRQAVSPSSLCFYLPRNRHLPGWRFLRFTMIVTVKAPICKVIRMSLTPFRVVWPTACRSCSA